MAPSTQEMFDIFLNSPNPNSSPMFTLVLAPFCFLHFISIWDLKCIYIYVLLKDRSAVFNGLNFVSCCWK